MSELNSSHRQRREDGMEEEKEEEEGERETVMPTWPPSLQRLGLTLGVPLGLSREARC